MRVLNLEPSDFSAEAIRVIESCASYRELPKCLTRDDAAFWEEVASADVIWTRLGFRIDREMVQRALRLKVVASPTTGLNHIDVTACKEKGVTVLSLVDTKAGLSAITATAELTFGLLLEAMRHMGPAQQSVREGSWDRDRFKGRQLSGQRLGVVGLGRLGRMVAAYAHAFRMETVFHDSRDDAALQPEPFVRRVSLEDLVTSCDVVSLHASYSPENDRMFSSGLLSRMKRTAWLINTARGELVDEAALLEALQTGRIGGAALDVLSGETTPGRIGMSHPLIEYANKSSNLIITPHIGGACTDAMAATEILIAIKLSEFLSTLSAA